MEQHIEIASAAALVITMTAYHDYDSYHDYDISMTMMAHSISQNIGYNVFYENEILGR